MRFFLILAFIGSFVLNMLFVTSGAIGGVEKYVALIQKQTRLSNRKPAPLEQKLFVVDDFLKEKVNFWEKIYSKYSSDFSIMHDSRHMSAIYEVLDFQYFNQKKYSPIQKELIRNRMILKTRIKIVEALTKIEKLKSEKKLNVERLNDYEKKIYKSTLSVDNFSYKGASRRLRQQVGQADMVDLAIKRSEKYINAMEKILVKNGIPKELVLLTFLESSFNISAVSSVGAAGVWQIMPEMGRKFLTINNIMDERKDPIKSTRVAAIILKESYAKLKDWPLAITSYNVGWPSVRRALKNQKEKNIVTFIKGRYRGVGFASTNFYAGFIAMLNVCLARNKDFLEIDKNSTIRFKVVTIKHDSKLRNILHGAKLNISDFKTLNPEFNKSIYLSRTKIPRGTKIKIPINETNETI